MATTPVYGWPYQALGDAPNGASMGEDLALAIEATVNALTATVASLTADLALVTGRPIARLRQTGAQAIGTGADTPVNFDAEDIDTHNGWVVGSPSRYTFPYTGKVVLFGGISWAASAVGLRALSWALNGAAINGSSVLDEPTATGNLLRQTARPIVLDVTAGQYAELWAFQTSGGNLNTSVTTSEQPSMDVYYLLRTT